MMLRFHIRQNLRSTFFLTLLITVLAIPLVLWQANRNGLPDSWRNLIERELANQGIHLEIGAIRYLPLQGIAANDVRIFADPERENELSRIGRVLLDFDKTKLARGDLRLKKMQLANADVLLAADAGDPASDVLEITHVHGRMAMPGGRVLEIRNATGRVGGVDVTVDARLLGYRSTGGLPEESELERGKRREFIASLSRELIRWSYPEDQRPHIKVRINGDLSDMRAFSSSFEFAAPVMSLNHHTLENVSISGKLTGQLLVLEGIRADDATGALAAHADYDMRNRTGRFDLECGLNLKSIARAWFNLETPDELLLGGSQTLKAAGKFAIPPESRIPEIQATGHLACGSVMVRGVVFDHAEATFSLRGTDVFLRDARVERADGAAWGKVLIQWPSVRMAMETTLPPPVYKPFFIGQPLEQVIESFSVSEDSKTHVILDGGFLMHERHSWAYEGSGRVENVDYNGVPVTSAATVFSLNHDELDFRNGTLVLDTSAYRQRTAYGGPQETEATVGRIRYIHEDRVIEVQDVSGGIWVPPVVAIFNAELAKNLETYQFHRPPNVRASGLVDLTSAGRTNLEVRFDSRSPAATDVLGQVITFTRAKGRVLLRGERVEVRDLELAAFGGPVNASFTHASDALAAEIAWTTIDLPAMAGAYGVTMQGGGTTTGRIEFSLAGGKVATLQGKGHAGFENAHLFAVPILGPLSPLIATIVNDSRTGYERAKDAFLSFEIERGLIRSNDFRTTTTNLAITGDGEIDLNDSTVEMTMRVNARGLLGLITLPLRPFYGLFQFRGTGPMREPEWENVMFTNPPPAQKKNLLNPPKARVVAEP